MAFKRSTIFPLLFRPMWCATRNRWRKSVDLRREAGRDIFLLVFSVLVMGALYWGTAWALGKANQNPNLAFLPPSAFFGFVLLLLVGMLFLTGILATIGSLFMAEDLDLILCTPVSKAQVFFGRFLYIWLSSAWMPFLFAIPFIVAFGQVYSAAWWYYPLAMLTLIPFFVLPAALGTVVGTCILSVIPTSRVRETCALILLSGFVGLYLVIDAIRMEWNTLSSAEVLVRVMASLSTPHLGWLPSAWVGFILEEQLKPAGHPVILYGVLLVTSSLAAVSLAYTVLLALHDYAFSRVRDRRIAGSYDSESFRRLLRTLSRFLDPEYRALVGKELRVISRDIGQVVQILVLLVLGLVYLYHLRIFAVAESFPDHMRAWWRNFLFMGNMLMGSFLTTAICTRFVFPSISFEGRAFWILQTSPLELHDLLRVKFWVWFVPVSILSALFFAAGAFAIGASGTLILVSAASSVLVCYGIVGLAIGLGAVFAYFEWEHASQLAGGFGSLMYMLSATLLILLNTVPAWMILVTPRLDPAVAAPHYAIPLLALNLIGVLVLNILVARFAFERGISSLHARMLSK